MTAKATKRWSRRLLAAVLLILWLTAMCLPGVAFILANRGELSLGNTDASHLRLFLVLDGDAEGLGLEWTRRSRRESLCMLSNVSYLLWVGRGENVRYCQCRDLQTGGLLPSSLQDCDAPD